MVSCAGGHRRPRAICQNANNVKKEELLQTTHIQTHILDFFIKDETLQLNSLCISTVKIYDNVAEVTRWREDSEERQVQCATRIANKTVFL
jgi:hypothetical protein